MAEAKQTSGRVEGDKIKAVRRGHILKTLQAIVKTSAFTVNELGSHSSVGRRKRTRSDILIWITTAGAQEQITQGQQRRRPVWRLLKQSNGR